MTMVAVESGLRPFQDALKSAGFVVVELTGADDSDIRGAHALVLSESPSTGRGGLLDLSAPVITAMGRTPAEVVNEVRRSLGPRE